MRESEGGWKRKVAVAAELVGGANPRKKMDMVLEEEGGKELDGGAGVFVWFFLGERGSEVSRLGLATRLVAARGVLFRVGWRYFGRGEKTEEVSERKERRTR